jgi:hypothetical protein
MNNDNQDEHKELDGFDFEMIQLHIQRQKRLEYEERILKL